MLRSTRIQSQTADPDAGLAKVAFAAVNFPSSAHLRVTGSVPALPIRT